MQWDPEVEAPATIAIIGAGPVGIEAALYARFLGYDILLFDSGRPARFVKRWHQRMMPSIIEKLTTPLGWAALASQHGIDSRPELSSEWLGQDFEATYLTPIAKTDLLQDFVYFNTHVQEVSRLTSHAYENVDLQERCNDEFFLRVNSSTRGEQTVRADLVFDCRSLRQRLLGIGPGGSRAIGQTEKEHEFLQYFPLDDRFEKTKLEGKKLLLCGCSEEAILFATEFQQLEWANSSTALIWLVRPTEKATAEQHMNAAGRVHMMVGYGVTKLSSEGAQTVANVLTTDESSVELKIDNVVGLYSSQFDPSIAPTLDLSPLRGIHSEWPGWTYATREPHYYVFPSVAHELSNHGLTSAHHAIRDVFALLGGRSSLDLYQIIAQQGI